MNKHWQLRDEWYRIFHHWPALTAFFLLGGLLGWLAGWIWPAYYRAGREIFVGLNPYRAYSDAQFLALAKPRFSNLDNYMYWQMNQLETVVFRHELLREALDSLRQDDPYWNNVDAETLGSMLDVNWRTAGGWQLNAIHADKQHAQQAVQAWSEAVLAAVPEAVSAARQTFVLDQQLGAAARASADLRLRQEGLAAAARGLEDWRAKNAALSQGALLPVEERVRLDALTTVFALDDAAWQALLQAQPAPQAPASDFLAWSAQAQTQMQAELELLPGKLAAIEEEAQSLQAQYNASADASLGLSPNLAVDSVGAVQVERVRPTSTLALIGAFLGMFGWLLMQIAGIQRSQRTDAAAIPGSSKVESGA